MVLNSKRCRICNSLNIYDCKTVKDSKTYLKGHWNLIKCRTCNVFYICCPPNYKEMHPFYYNYYTHVYPPKDSLLVNMIYKYHYGYVDNYISFYIHQLIIKNINLLPPKKKYGSTKLLDFGCGNGHLMLRFEKYGFKCTGFDIDYNSIAVAKELGLEVFSGNFFNIDFNKKFDVVILNQSLEHLYDPSKYLKHIRSLLEDNGQLIISVPNSSSVDFHILKDSWTSFQAPTHIYHFNRDSLSFLLNKVGFKIIKISYSSPLNSLKPTYLFKNFKNIFKLQNSIFFSVIKSLLFAISSILSITPKLNRHKRIRISVYCIKQ